MHGLTIGDLENDLWPTFQVHVSKKLFLCIKYSVLQVVLILYCNSSQFNLVMHRWGYVGFKTKIGGKFIFLYNYGKINIIS
jgi:hypothetical protein